MKVKYALIALLAISFYGCDDNTAGLGLGMFPGSDQNLNGKLSTFDVTTESVETGRIYAKTNVGYVGKFTDDTFGSYSAGFLATLNCPAGTTFPTAYKENESKTAATGILVTDFKNIGLAENVKNDFVIIKNEAGEVIGNCKINIYLWYSSYFGDSLTACRLSVYQLDQKLSIKENPYYTDIIPEDYYNATKPTLLGTKAYTAVDLSVKDSIRKLSTYVPSVGLRLNKEMTEKLGQKMLEKGKDKNFSNIFIDEIFKGLYVKSDYGDGTVLYINQVQMDVSSIRYATDSITGLKKQTKYSGKDSIQYTGRSFYSTREVIQANQLKNDPEKINALIKEGTNTYLKSPAGIFTQATLPIDEIASQLTGDSLNAVKLTFSNYNQSSDKKFGMSIPQNVMLIRVKDKDVFFEKNQLPDNVSSYLTSHTTSSNQYVFSNITQLINTCMKDKEEAKAKGTTLDENWDKVVLIPVLLTSDSSNSNSADANIIAVQHDLKPGYVRLKGGSDGKNTGTEGEKYRLKLEVLSTNFGATTTNNK